MHVMDMIRQFVSESLEDFSKVAAVAGAEYVADTIVAEFLPKPHKLSGLPAGNQLRRYLAHLKKERGVIARGILVHGGSKKLHDDVYGSLTARF